MIHDISHVPMLTQRCRAGSADAVEGDERSKAVEPMCARSTWSARYAADTGTA